MEAKIVLKLVKNGVDFFKEKGKRKSKPKGRQKVSRRSSTLGSLSPEAPWELKLDPRENLAPKIKGTLLGI